MRGNSTHLRRFYETFVMGDDYDEVAYLAQFGLALRLEAPRQRLAAARRRRCDAIAALPPEHRKGAVAPKSQTRTKAPALELLA